MRRLPWLDDIFSANRTVWWIHGCGLSLVVMGVLATELLVVRPLRDQTQQEQSQIDQLEGLLNAGEGIRAEFNQRREQLEGERARQVALHQRVPDEPMEAAFLAQVAGLARGVDLEVKDYRPGTITQHADYSELKVELQVIGTYGSICRFLDQIPRLPRISSFTGMEISAEPEKSIYPIRLNFSTYFVPMNNSTSPSTDLRGAREGGKG
jgi:Tfp pilus assembly protein PilO